MSEQSKILMPILQKLVPYRALAEGFIEILKLQEASPDQWTYEVLLAQLVELLSQSVQNAQESYTKQQMQQALQRLQDIQKREQNARVQDQIESNRLLDEMQEL